MSSKVRHHEREQDLANLIPRQQNTLIKKLFKESVMSVVKCTKELCVKRELHHYHKLPVVWLLSLNCFSSVVNVAME